MSDPINEPCDTVFILGAGFSFDAGVPLMAHFIDRMWEFAVRGTNDDVPLTPDDLAAFRAAEQVRAQLNEYHGRAAFDDRNIEDILSILSFAAYRSSAGRTDLSTMTRAIARTIELCCRVRFIDPNGQADVPIVPDGSLAPYTRFWNALLQLPQHRRRLPTIITFNYDLVLERSLMQLLNGLSFSPETAPWRGDHLVNIRYRFDEGQDTGILVRPQQYRAMSGVRIGLAGQQVDPAEVPNATTIELLKLHGSVNFRESTEGVLGRSHGDLVTPEDSPLILPPIFNKQFGERLQPMWATALQRLRTAKHVVIVGYSLPRTDVYMQYFLKAALGPNRDLSRIFVFDPAMYTPERAKDIKARYSECFSPQLQSRIHFQPSDVGIGRGDEVPGSMRHFVRGLEQAPLALVF